LRCARRGNKEAETASRRDSDHDRHLTDQLATSWSTVAHAGDVTRARRAQGAA
jgi:hypothetical protein